MEFEYDFLAYLHQERGLKFLGSALERNKLNHFAELFWAKIENFQWKFSILCYQT